MNNQNNYSKKSTSTNSNTYNTGSNEIIGTNNNIPNNNLNNSNNTNTNKEKTSQEKDLMRFGHTINLGKYLVTISLFV